MKDFKNIREIIEYSQKTFPNNIAFKIKQKKNGKTEYDEVTYTRLAQEIRAFSKYLISEGLQGKRVAVIGKNSYRWMLVYLSVLCSGGTIVPLDKGLLLYEIKEQLARSSAEAVFYSDNLSESFAEIDNIKKTSLDSEELEDMLAIGERLENDADYDEIEIDENAMSILIFTSGTTQKSKAVMLSQKNITANVKGMTQWERFYETDVNLAILPFHHAFGMTQIVLFLSYGMCNVFADGLRIARALTEYRVTVLVGVPLILEGMRNIMLKEMKRLNMEKKFNMGLKISKVLRSIGIDMRSRIFKSVTDKLGGGLRLIINGAAAIKPETSRWFNDIGILMIQGYGLSETAPVVSAENEEHIRYGSVGLPLPGETVKICDKDENGIGEIAVKGENVMLGYYEDEENTAKVLKDGWFYTGDMGYLDKDGYLFITGRKKYVIVLSNGKNVFPEETELLLCEAPIVKECIVYNRKNRGKDYLCAKVVYDTEVEANAERARELVAEQIKRVNSRLIKYKQIMDFEISDVEMDKTTTGKIKR